MAPAHFHDVTDVKIEIKFCNKYCRNTLRSLLNQFIFPTLLSDNRHHHHHHVDGDLSDHNVGKIFGYSYM